MSKQARKSRGPSVVESEIPRLTPQEIFEGYERHLYSVCLLYTSPSPRDA